MYSTLTGYRTGQAPVYTHTHALTPGRANYRNNNNTRPETPPSSQQPPTMDGHILRKCTRTHTHRMGWLAQCPRCTGLRPPIRSVFCTGTLTHRHTHTHARTATHRTGRTGWGLLGFVGVCATDEQTATAAANGNNPGDRDQPISVLNNSTDDVAVRGAARCGGYSYCCFSCRSAKRNDEMFLFGFAQSHTAFARLDPEQLVGGIGRACDCANGPFREKARENVTDLALALRDVHRTVPLSVHLSLTLSLANALCLPYRRVFLDHKRHCAKCASVIVFLVCLVF